MHPEVTPDLARDGLAKPTNLLGIQLRSPSCNPDERIMSLAPITCLHDNYIPHEFATS